jgi:CBS domain-containing protein
VKFIRVGDLMTTDVVTITPQTHLLTILDIMLKRHIRRLPVVSDQEVVGIVSKTDMAGAYYAGLTMDTLWMQSWSGPCIPVTRFHDDDIG